MKNANCNNHDGDGQNVGYTDAHVVWVTTPFAGVQRNTARDNIYTSSTDTDNSTGANASIIVGPQDSHDSVLLPTDDQTI
jgi:hypothetical protein